ncbi:MAG: hypothetical protein HDR04_03830 [Lachnospiraceae bacterium]|nr:hypothetical protein [Lachnospiraceae bacterium]
MRKESRLSSPINELQCSRNRILNIKGAKSGFALILAALLAIAPAVDVLAVEEGQSVSNHGTAERMEDSTGSRTTDGNSARQTDTGEVADDSTKEITSVEDANETLASYKDEETEWEEIYIDSVEELKAFSRKCWLDTWSQNKKVYLRDDLNLAGSEFISIPTFGGYFDGQGHTISGLTIRDCVSYTGLFCYTQKSAVIANLNVQGAVRPSGNQMVVGGIVGDNSGIIINCNYEGTVEGNDYVGGITGFNELSGILMDCKNSGKITGAHYTGGIAGENIGNIVGCTNAAQINTSNEDKGKSLEDINLTQYTTGFLDNGEGSEAEKEAAVISNTIDSGGIAGLSTGIIQFCSNSGEVGYEHVGYNIGGIVGRQSGYVYACENTGTVYGRKDVGGIAGQTEPYIAVDLSEDIAYQLMDNIDKMHDLTGQMLDDAGAESDTVSARLSIVQDFVDKALEDTSFLADRTVGWTDEMIGSVNEAVNRLDYIMDESTKDDGVIDYAHDAAGNVKDAAEKLGDMVDSLDIYQYMTPAEKERYDNAKENMERATKQHAEDYAEAMEAYKNYYIDRVRSTEDKYKQSDQINENDLKPRFESGVDSGWSWSGSNTYENYFGVTGWVHHNPDTGEDRDFPQSEGDLGTLDHDLLDDADKQMAEDIVRVQKDASDYADKQYSGGDITKDYDRDMREYLEIMSDIVMAHQDEMTEEAAKQLKSAMGYVEDAAGNMQSAGSEARHMLDTLNGMPDIALPQLGGDYRSRTNSLTANLQGLSENMGRLNDEMSSTNDVLIDDLSDINDQFSTIMRLYTDAIDGVLDMDYSNVYEDTSQENAETSTDATIADCRNGGLVQGDINVSGIAGTMAIEYDFDLEGDVTGIENAKMNSTLLTKCVQRGNINVGKVMAHKSCAGGISGLQEMGTILRCENYGRIETSTGNYAGGVAGQSVSYIMNSYAKCTVSGKEYVAGIAGSGSSIENCCAIVRIQESDAFSGAIAGDTDSSGTVLHNYFVSDEIAGIDRISYSGKAEPIGYQEMLEIEGIPNKFRMMTISFYADEEEVKMVECPYGGSVPIDLYPEIPAKPGFYADWDIKDLNNVLYDEDVTVEYVRYLTTLASEQMRPNGQSVILADGMFKQEDVLNVTGGISSVNSTTDAALPDDVAERWTVEIPDDSAARMKTEETDENRGAHTLRYQAPEGQTEGVSIYVKQDGGWKQADTELMGIYHLFTVATADGANAEIAVCIYEKGITDYLIYIIPTAVVLLVLLILIIRKTGKKKKAKKAAETEAPNQKEAKAAQEETKTAAKEEKK